MMNQDTEHRLMELLSALSAETVTEAQFKELDEILCQHVEARQIYRDYLAVDDRLASGEMLFAEVEREKKPISTKRRDWLLWAAAAAIVLAGFVIINSMRETGDPKMATVRSVDGTVWWAKRKPLQPGESIDKEWLRIDKGVVQLEFQTGALVSVEGPASLRIVGEGECFVERGTLVVLAPAEIGSFKVNTHSSEVVDLGTEFAVAVGEAGDMVVHVLDGEVEIGIKDLDANVVSRERLVEKHAARLVPGKSDLQHADYDGPAFERLRAETIRRKRPLRIQFDCGSQSGVYQGTESPAHAVGEMYSNESFWNPLNGDQTGRFVMSDGEIAAFEIEVDYGRRDRREFSWNSEPDLMRGVVQATRGVFDTSLCKDHLGGSGQVGMRVRGLPPGEYRVYLVGRTVNDHKKWGNYLVTKAYKSVISANVVDLDSGDLLFHDPLNDPDAKSWKRNQTHVVADVEISGPDDYLTILTTKDRSRSPKPGGGNSVISAIQIIQLRTDKNLFQR